MKSLVHFITYNNAVPIALGVLFLGAGGALAASPEVRHAVYATKEIIRAVDNTQLLAANIDSYRFNVKVNSVTEDDTNYYVDYSYTTLAVSDGVWRDFPKSNHMKISKRSMTGRDLGLFVAEQIGQVISQEMADLKQVQYAEKTKGVTPKVVAVEYSGLVGRMFDTKEMTFPGYVPVVVPVVSAPPEVVVMSQTPEIAAVASADLQIYSQTPVTPPSPEPPPAPSPQDIRTMVDEAINAYLATKAAEAVAPSTTPVSDVPSPTPPPEPPIEQPLPPPTATPIEEPSPSPTPPFESPIEQPPPPPSDVPVEQPVPLPIDTPIEPSPLPVIDTLSSPADAVPPVDVTAQ
ncbi:MAG: hypothetical protein Q8L37_00140 [Candidatus Gottesmanbacteria bacterium]|nr:hypothetical protein [Candidatus Gottesmanbacteria bacterium]